MRGTCGVFVLDEGLARACRDESRDQAVRIRSQPLDHTVLELEDRLRLVGRTHLHDVAHPAVDLEQEVAVPLSGQRRQGSVETVVLTDRVEGYSLVEIRTALDANHTGRIRLPATARDLNLLAEPPWIDSRLAPSRQRAYMRSTTKV